MIRYLSVILIILGLISIAESQVEVTMTHVASTHNAVSIKSTTNVTCLLVVHYGLDSNFGQVKACSCSPGTSQKVVIDSLLPHTSYHFKLVTTMCADDLSGNSTERVLTTKHTSLKYGNSTTARFTLSADPRPSTSTVFASNFLWTIGTL